MLAVGEPHDTTAWGGGIVDIEACVRALDRVGYGGAYTVEHEPEDHDPSEECRAMREQLEGWLRMRIGIVGCGNIASRYAERIGAVDGLELVGATDVDPAAAERLVAAVRRPRLREPRRAARR